tara:strand:+ start:488 stop:832 length:345 start_codon:yes stop_codon:yes gene_type:complete
LTFFGLSYDNAPQARNAVFSQIHEIVFHGKGGYDWHTIYDMPVWLRRFTFNKIHKFYQEEKEQYDNAKSSKNKTVINPDGKIESPEFLSKPSLNTPKPTISSPPTSKKPSVSFK